MKQPIYAVVVGVALIAASSSTQARQHRVPQQEAMFAARWATVGSTLGVSRATDLENPARSRALYLGQAREFVWANNAEQVISRELRRVAPDDYLRVSCKASICEAVIVFNTSDQTTDDLSRRSLAATTASRQLGVEHNEISNLSADGTTLGLLMYFTKP